MHHGCPDAAPRPAATFAVVSYNQGHLVHEAVASALAQSYQPLHVLLSDDHSTDRTFAIMRELAAAYRGPHRVTVRQNPVNLGIIGHYNQVLAQADTDVVIVAPGDDVSLPHRAERLMARFLAGDRTLAVHSSVVREDTSGRVLGVWQPPVITQAMTLEQMASTRALHIGAAAAYHTELLRRFGPIAEPGTLEDLTLGFRAALLGGLAYVDEPLVRYRVGTGITTQPTPVTLLGRLARHRRRLARDHATMRQRMRDCAVVGADALADRIRGEAEAIAAAEALYAAGWSQLPGQLTARWRMLPRTLRLEAWYLRNGTW